MDERIILYILIKPHQKTPADHLSSMIIKGFSLKIPQMYEDQSSEGLGLRGCIIEQQYLANANTLLSVTQASPLLSPLLENNLAPLSGYRFKCKNLIKLIFSGWQGGEISLFYANGDQ